MTRRITKVSSIYPNQVVETSKVEPEFVDEPPRTSYVKKRTIFRFYQLIWYILAVIEVVLGFRILLRAVGADPGSSFSAWVYAFSEPLAIPFRGILRNSTNGIYVIEWSTIFGAVVYIIVAYGLVEFFQFFKPVTSDEVEETVDK